MSHPDHVTPDLSALLDGELTDSERLRVEAHLGECPDCAAQRDLLASALGLVGRAESVEPSPALRRRVLEAFDSARPPLLERLRRWLAPRYLLPLTAVATAGVVIAVGHHVNPTPATPDELAMAEKMDLLQDLDVLEAMPAGVDPADLDVVAHLDELGE